MISPINNPTEGASASFLIHRSQNIGGLTATYGTPTGTATEGADYNGSYFNNRTVNFLNGQSDAILSFSTIDDTLVEPTESLIVGLTGAPGYTIVGGPATVLIYDNDTPTSPPTGPPSPQVPPVPPKIEFVDSADTATVELKVARWENSFIRDAGSGINNKPKAEFIDTDPDRFKVRVTDEAANKNANAKETINVLVKTDFDTTGHELTLTETEANSGVFVSKTLLMTSTRVDDEYKVDDIEDSTKNDRTLRILNLGQKATVEYLGKAVSATVPLKNVVYLHANVVRTDIGGKPALFFNGQVETEEADITKSVELFVRTASAIYAPMGIQFRLVDGKVNYVNPPAGLSLAEGLTGWTVINNKVVLSADEKKLLGDEKLRTEDKGDIEVYFISDLKTGFDWTFGEAIAPSYSPDIKVNDSILIGKINGLQLLAHEIGHILLDDGGHADATTGTKQTLIMTDISKAKDVVSDSRRFTTAQAQTVTTKRKDLLQKPK